MLQLGPLQAVADVDDPRHALFRVWNEGMGVLGLVSIILAILVGIHFFIPRSKKEILAGANVALLEVLMQSHPVAFILHLLGPKLVLVFK